MALSVVDSNGDPIDTGSIVDLTVVRGPRRGTDNGENFGILLSQTVKLPSTNERAFLTSSNHDSREAAVLLSSSRRCRSDCVRYGVLSYGCPAGAVCVPDGAYHGVWAGPGTCFWGI
ncbi:hypothetical protein V5799_023441 [Amblyomma americanum]|uniref:Uncharacterized protein n=1 Tax=Amblyomma americanum TaxID=6943 RepID=A0AAQ4FHH6_AMBAM